MRGSEHVAHCKSRVTEPAYVSSSHAPLARVRRIVIARRGVQRSTARARRCNLKSGDVGTRVDRPLRKGGGGPETDLLGNIAPVTAFPYIAMESAGLALSISIWGTTAWLSLATRLRDMCLVVRCYVRLLCLLWAVLWRGAQRSRKRVILEGMRCR